MDKIELLHEMQECLIAMTELYMNLDDALAYLSGCTQEEEFIFNDIEPVTQDLLKVEQYMKRYRELSGLVGKTLIPCKIEAAKKEVQEDIEKLEKKSVYYKIIDRFCALHSKEESIEQLLIAHKKHLKRLDIDKMTEEVCARSLEKYEDFLQALEEKNPVMLVRHVQSLSSRFEDDLIAHAIMCKDLYVEEDKDASDTQNEMQAEKTTDHEETKQIELEEAELTISSTSKEEEPRDESSEQADDTENERYFNLLMKHKALIPEDYQCGKLTVEKSPKESKKFGFKEFKSDLLNGYGEVKKKIMNYVDKYNSVTPGLIADTTGANIDVVKMGLDNLLKKGYLRKYMLEGAGEFHCMSPRGEKAFHSKEACTLLGVRNVRQEAEGEPVEDFEVPALCRIIYSRMFELDCNMKHLHSITSAQIIGTSYFLLSIADYYDTSTYDLFTGFYAKDSMDCKNYFYTVKEYLKERDDIERFIVAGINGEHARHMMNAILEEINVAGERFCYDFTENKFYLFDSDEVIDPSEIWKKQDEEEDDLIADFLGEAASDDYAASEETMQVDMEEDPCADLLDPGSDGFKELDDNESMQLSFEDMMKEYQNRDWSIFDEKEDVKAASMNPANDTAATVIVEEEKNASSTTSASSAAVTPVATTVIPEFEKHLKEDYQKMIVDDHIYCASAYLKAASILNEKYVLLYRKLAYAVNDPMENCRYTSDKIFDLYFDDNDTACEYYMVAALLRNYFSDHIEYDYSMKSLYSNVKECSIISEAPSLEKVIYELMEFKDQVHKGIDVYADYRGKDNAAWEAKIEKVRKEANEYYDSNITGYTVEKASNKRFIETKRMIFAPEGDMANYLKIVADDEREMLPLLKDFLKESFIKEDSTIEYVNIDHDKVNNFMDQYWQQAGQKMLAARKTSNLMSSLRNNLFNAIVKCVKVLCDWTSLVSSRSMDAGDAGMERYVKVRSSVLTHLIESAAYFRELLETTGQCSMEQRAGIKVLLYTLNELQERLDGSYDESSSKYFYIDFLRSDSVLLDDTYRPDFRGLFLNLGEFSLMERVKKHEGSTLDSFEHRLEVIFNEYGDDYGSACLIDSYLEEKTGESLLAEKYNVKESVTYAKNSALQKKDEFIGNLELAQSYGQIDNSREDKKEKILQIVNEWYEITLETENYGFFVKLLHQFQKTIKEEAKVREESIARELALFCERHPELAGNEEFTDKLNRIQTMMEIQNYTVAEDLLNRLNSNESESDFELFKVDYLQKFYEEYDYNYKKVADSSKKLSAMMIGSSRSNKDTKGGKRLLDNWLTNGGHLGEQKLMMLLSALGFDVANVREQAKISKIENYNVVLKKPENGRKVNFKHPIAAFGSKASEEGFRVVCLFGKFDADRLIDVFKDLGNAKNTLVLLDYALTVSDRRRLARKVKKEASDKIFGVIDRVLLMYLINNYAETSINRVLMSIMMPFSYYQPYVVDSANIMPPEIFMGRREELEKIESATGVNIVYGGRQLGKSALLRMAKGDIDRNENHDRAVLVEIKGLNYKSACKKIGHALYDEGVLTQEIETEDWNELARVIKKRLLSKTDQKIPYLLLLLDEADTFIESCEEVNYHPFDALKDIQSVGVERFKFVIAGLRNIVRFKREAALGNNSVLTHLKSMTVTPFKLAEARELLETPLYYLGLRFPKEKDYLVSLILASTNYFPGLIQLYCAKLVEAMKKNDYAGYNESETPSYEIRENHIKKVLAESDFRQQIREKFEITLKLDEDNYYYIIALIMAHLYHENGYNEGYSPEDIYNIGCEFDIKRIKNLSVDKIAALMDELRELNVFRITSENRYLYTRYSFFQMMGSSQEVDDKMMDYMEV